MKKSIKLFYENANMTELELYMNGPLQLRSLFMWIGNPKWQSQQDPVF